MSPTRGHISVEKGPPYGKCCRGVEAVQRVPPPLEQGVHTADRESVTVEQAADMWIKVCEDRYRRGDRMGIYGGQPVQAVKFPIKFGIEDSYNFPRVAPHHTRRIRAFSFARTDRSKACGVLVYVWLWPAPWRSLQLDD